MPLNRPKIMGILNVTPDSFSDGGSYLSRDQLCVQIERLLEEGADIIDIGGESTRPYAEPVSCDEEMSRVLPAIEIVRQISDMSVSVDTTKAEVARQALAAGATMINDISAFRMDSGMIDVAKAYEGPVVIMHMQGTPGNMQVNPQYADVVADICTFFEERIAWLDAHGVARNRVIIDPGIGFGKTLAHNLEIFRNIEQLREIGCPVLIGHSRKSFLDKLLSIPMEERDCATAVISALCTQMQVDILRVHNVKETRRAIELALVFRKS